MLGGRTLLPFSSAPSRKWRWLRCRARRVRGSGPFSGRPGWKARMGRSQRSFICHVAHVAQPMPHMLMHACTRTHTHTHTHTHNRTVWAFGGPTGPEKMCRKMAQTRFIACPFGQLDAISRRFSKKKKCGPCGSGANRPHGC